MENIKIRCRSCGKELEGISGKSVSCGCPNMATIRNGVISAVDLGQVVMLNSYGHQSKSGVLSNEDLAYQEARRQRKVRKLDFEIR
jgi:phage FluMu protein Com